MAKSKVNGTPKDKIVDDPNPLEDRIKGLEDLLTKQADENKRMLNAMGQIAGVVKEQRGTITELQGRMEAPPKDAPKDPPAEDLENMNRADYTNFLIGKMGEMMASHVKPVSERMESALSDIETRFTKEEVASFRGKTPQFEKWQEEMGEEIKNIPDISISDAYLLARAKNPDKSKELDTTDAEEAKKADDARRAEIASQFGGLPPGGTGDETSRDDMEPREASEAAWSEMADLLGGEGKLHEALGTDVG